MARRSLSDRFNRTLTLVGGQSLCITIPKEYLNDLGWKKGQELEVLMNKRAKRLIVKKPRIVRKR